MSETEWRTAEKHLGKLYVDAHNCTSKDVAYARAARANAETGGAGEYVVVSRTVTDWVERPADRDDHDVSAPS